jgi:MoaA/NifB/PqqE/SkfB family radical SAM enzyme
MDYGFRDRLSAEFPSQVIIDVTEVCNLACIHCPHPTFKKSEHYAARYLDPMLAFKAVDEVWMHGAGHTQYIRFTSEGEPLIHPQCYDMMQYAVDHSGSFVTLTTNGTIMNEKRIGRLLNSGLHMIDISLDAYEDDTYAKIRVNGHLPTVRNNVLKLIDMVRGTRTQVVVSFVRQEGNWNEADDFRTFWTNAGAHAVVIRNLHSAAGAIIPVAAVMRAAQSHGPKRRPCVYPWERIVLTPGGNLAFCPADWTHGSTMIDYRTTTIRETWKGDFYAKLREAHLSNEFSCHKFCGQCPDWAVTRWPGEGRAYADLVEEMKGH